MSKIKNSELMAVRDSAAEVMQAIAGKHEEINSDDSSKMCRLWDDLNDRYAPPHVVKSIADELLNLRKSLQEKEAELARLKTREPYGYVAESPCSSGYGGMMYDFYIDKSDATEDANSNGGAVISLYAEPRPAVLQEWTDEQCLDFMSVAFRHAEISGDIEMDDIRLGMKIVNAGGEIAE